MVTRERNARVFGETLADMGIHGQEGLLAALPGSAATTCEDHKRTAEGQLPTPSYSPRLGLEEHKTEGRSSERVCK